MSKQSQRNIRGFELKQEIGKGGFGVVYRAYQAILKREVALKVILPQYANDPDFIRRFEHEAEVIAQLEHINIVPLYDYWRESDGAYLVMRFIRGGSLSELLTSGQLELPQILNIIDQVTEGLSLAHRNKIVHRDIKPDNILLDEDGNAYLTDFGIATSPDYDSQSPDDSITGSLPYAAPEQIQNDEIRPQTDIYALGIMLYEMLTGKHPFGERTIIQMVFAQLDEALPDIRDERDDLGFEINEIIQKSTAKDPDNRFENVREITTALRASIGGEIPVIVTSTNPGNLDNDLIDLINPYKGLRAFHEHDQDDFYGRDALTEQLVNRFEEADERFLAVVGPSGSGKSSIVKAGIIPRLRAGALVGSEDWFIVEMFPGSMPFAELEATLLKVAVNPPDSLIELLKGENGIARAVKRILPDENSEILLVIDQFEELFTLVEDENRRIHFIESLLIALDDPRSRLRIIVTLRADFYDRPLMYHDLGLLIRKRTEVVLPLSKEELSTAILQPANNAGAVFEMGLLDTILHDVDRQSGILPLLQYVLTEMFENRRGRILTIEVYRELGGVTGALAKRAEEIYAEIDETQQLASRQLFLRLVTLGEGTEDTRRRVRHSELDSIKALDPILKIFGDARLLTFDRDANSREPTVEVAHEALIRTWKSLREWINHNREDLQIHRRLTFIANEWETVQQDPSFLATGMRLDQFEGWSEITELVLSKQERAFIAVSIEERVRKRKFEKERKDHEILLERKSRERLRYLLVVFAIATVLSGGLSIFAFNQANATGHARDRAEAAQLAAESSAFESQQFAAEARSLALASGALREYSEGNAELALALALDAVDTDETLLAAPPELAYNALFEIAYEPGIVYEESASDFPIEHLVISPDGRYAVFGNGINASQYWREITSPAGIAPPGSAAGIAPPGRPTFDLNVWDINGRNIQRQFSAHQTFITDIVFCTQADGTVMLISASDDGQVIFWDYEIGTILNEMTISAGFLVLSPSVDGETLLVASNGQDGIEGTMAIVDISSAEIIIEYPVPSNLALARMTLDSRYIVGLLLNGGVVTWDANSGEEIAMTNIRTPLRPDSADMLISPDNNTVAINTGGDTIPLIDLLTGRSKGVVVPSVPGTHRATFNDDGSQMLAVSRDGIVTVWDIEGQFFVRDFRTILSFATTITWQSTNDIAIVTPSRGTVRVYSIDGEPTNLIDTIGNRNTFYAEWLNQTEVLLGYHGANPELTLWDMETGLQRPLVAINDANYSLSLSPDKQFAIVVPRDSASGFRIIDLNSGDVYPCTSFCRYNENAIFLNTSPNRVVVTDDGEVSLWDLETQSELWQSELVSTDISAISVLIYLESYNQPIASSHDGTLIAIAMSDGNVNIFDAETGEAIGLYSDRDTFETIAFSPDNMLLALVTTDESIVRLIDWRSGSVAGELFGHDADITSMEFLSDGKRMVTSSDDTSVILWDIETGSILNQFDHDLLVFNVSLSPDETQILTTSEDALAHIWRLEKLSLEGAIAWALENRIVRRLTQGECVRYPLSSHCQEHEEEH